MRVATRVIFLRIILVSLIVFAVTRVGLGARISPVSLSLLSFEATRVGTSSSPKVITVTNHEDSPLVISNVTATADYATHNSCARPLRRNETCQIFVTFSPSFAGITTGKITVFSNRSTSPYVLRLSGAGVPRPLSEMQRSTLR